MNEYIVYIGIHVYIEINLIYMYCVYYILVM